MSFDRHYPKRQDWRRRYRDSRAVDRSCRNGGSCLYCEGTRRVVEKRIRAAVKIAVAEMETA